MDVDTVVNYAYSRGIIVIPEFDMPGHCASWQLGYPELSSNCPAEFDQLINPTSNFTFPFLTGFLSFISEHYTSEFIHMGSDEVDYSCWNNSDSVKQWMKENGIDSYVDLHNYFETGVQKIVGANGKSTILWQEAFDIGLNLLPDTIIDVWLSNQVLYDVVKAGHRGILSHGYYLDVQRPSHNYVYLWEDTWMDFYLNDPVNGTDLSPQELALILGGQACQWAEQVDDTVVDTRIWPRALGTAERLWSSYDLMDPYAALPRIISHRCRLVRRGIDAGPLRPDYCITPWGFSKREK